MNTFEQIESKKQEIKSDGYSMSIGELSNLYKEEDIELHPEFQRVFRWDAERKTQLIESILLGIPLPSIFVSQRKNGKWDIVDGLQRLSTIFEFMGILKDDNGNVKEKLKLTQPEIITNLKDKTWDTLGGENLNEDTSSIQILFKRSKIDVKIIQQDEKNTVKYELFKRLNSGGLNLTEQEVRNCLILLENKDFYDWLTELSKNENYIECISLPDDLVKESYNLEILVRFIAIYNTENIKEITEIRSFNKFLDKKIIDIAKDDKEKRFDRDKIKNTFSKTFEILNLKMSDNSFRKYYVNENRFRGKFLVSAFEAIATGLSTNIEKYLDNENNFKDELTSKIEERIKSLWSRDEFLTNVGGGIQTHRRISTTIPLGKEFFNPDNFK